VPLKLQSTEFPQLQAESALISPRWVPSRDLKYIQAQRSRQKDASKSHNVLCKPQQENAASDQERTLFLQRLISQSDSREVKPLSSGNYRKHTPHAVGRNRVNLTSR
jgi:hypothetical protein